MTGEKKRFRFLKRKENGQATVEFALLCPLLLGILFGIIDFGWIFFNIAMVNNSTRSEERLQHSLSPVLRDSLQPYRPLAYYYPLLCNA